MKPSPSDLPVAHRHGTDRLRCTASVLIFFLASTAFALLPCTDGAGAADSPRPEAAAAPEAPIEITADRLISDTQNHLARFEGNVKAVQGDTSIEADRLLIYYKADGSTKPATAAAAGTDALSKLVASGNVRIKFDNRLAVTDEAVYITDQRMLTLTGTPARVTSGQDQVSGKVIRFYRDSGRIEVQGGGGKQIEAIFHSGEKGIQ